jgi:hypothetical protein
VHPRQTGQKAFRVTASSAAGSNRSAKWPTDVGQLLFGTEDKLDTLACPLLEGRDDLPDRLVFVDVVAFVPSHDEIGGADVERRQNERQSAPYFCNRSCGSVPQEGRLWVILGHAD